MNIYGIIWSAVAVVMVGFLIVGACNRWLPLWACTKLGWHLPPSIVEHDGCSYHGRCYRCGIHVMQDSQGNWFSGGETDEY